MEDNKTKENIACRHCGGTRALAAADAKATGLLDEFLAGTYSCCEVVQWADEQWLAWVEAAREDGKAPEEVTGPLEVGTDSELVPVRVKKTTHPADRNLP